MNYYELFGLQKEPFSTSPDPSFFYLSSQHRAALCRLQIAITLKRGLCVILGDVGTGKTTLSRKLAQTLTGDRTILFHMILNPYFKSQKQFLIHLARLFHLDLPPRNVTGMYLMEEIERFLFQSGVEENKTVVLLIDEAQMVPDYVLELLRILLNYETNEYKILQLVLVGQLELLPRIKRMQNFWDRIALKCMLHPLDKDESTKTIEFRLTQAGCSDMKKIFTEEAVDIIYRHTHGYPRRFTLLCHNALEVLVMQNKTVVDVELIHSLIDREAEVLTTGTEGPPNAF